MSRWLGRGGVWAGCWNWALVPSGFGEVRGVFRLGFCGGRKGSVGGRIPLPVLAVAVRISNLNSGTLSETIGIV